MVTDGNEGGVHAHLIARPLEKGERGQLRKQAHEADTREVCTVHAQSCQRREQRQSAVRLRLKQAHFPDILLARGHQLHFLQDLGILYGQWQQQADGDLLATLSQLARLHLLDPACTHVDFLRSLPRLATLILRPSALNRMDWPRVIAAMRPCTHIEELRISDCCFTSSAQLVECLQCMPLLRALELVQVRGLDSLSFLSGSHITARLASLCLGWCTPRMPVREMESIRGLRAVRRVILRGWFDAELNEQQAALYRVPSAVMPSLCEFECRFH